MYKGEKFNSISHLVGASLALVGFVLLIVVATMTGDVAAIISFTVFGFSLFLLYTMSTLYHSLRPEKAKKIFQKFDHICIYILIAGTYTPYTMVTLGDGNGYLILSFVWGMALLGTLMELFARRRIEVLALVIYLSMGWSCVFDFAALQAGMDSVGIYFLSAGGLAYTVGIIFYVLDGMNKLKHAHGIWHLFVMVGSVCHYISVIGYVR